MLRLALPEDTSGVATVLIESRRVFLPFAPFAHPEHEMREWVRDVLVPGGRVMVWEEHGDIVGVLAISEGDGLSWIDQFYLLPEFVCQGIGSKMLMLSHAMLQKPIRLYTFQQNEGARRFYERHGYKAIELTDGQGNEERCPDVLYELK